MPHDKIELCLLARAIRAFALIGIGEIPIKDRKALDPSDFFGFEEDIKALQADPREAVRAIALRELDIDWDGTTTLRMAALARFKTDCDTDRGIAHLETEERNLSQAKKIIDNYRATGGISRAKYEEALVVAGIKEGPEIKPTVVTEPVETERDAAA